MKPKLSFSFSFSGTMLLFACAGYLFPMPSLAQEAINQVDDNGRKTGVWQGYHADGSLRYEGRFIDDRPQGEFRYYDESGRLLATNTFERNGRKAWHQAYDTTGFLLAEGIYLNQTKDSVWTYYSTADSAVIARESYQFGQKHGQSVTYYPQTGQKAEELYYENGKRNGDWKKYFDDGTLMSNGFYENDQLNGVYITYYPNGNINTKGQYMHDLQYGIWEFFDEDGNLVNTEKYQLKD